MQPQVEFFNLIRTTLEENLDLFSGFSANALPTTGGLYMELAAGYNDGIFLNKQANKVIPILFMGKSTNLMLLLDNLYQIGNYLQNLRPYPQGETFSWDGAEVSTEPTKVDYSNNYYTYSCIVDFKICI